VQAVASGALGVLGELAPPAAVELAPAAPVELAPPAAVELAPPAAVELGPAVAMPIEAGQVLHAVAPDAYAISDVGELTDPVEMHELTQPVADAEPSHAGKRNAFAPVAVDVSEAIEYTTHLAETGARSIRNGPTLAWRARNAIDRLVRTGTPPSDDRTIDALGWYFASAEQVARSYGARALEIVRTTAHAISTLIDDIFAQQQPRNLPSWVSTAGKVGIGVGALYFAPELAALGLSGPMIKLVEQELNAEGLTLGSLADPETSLASALDASAKKRAT
jgi:hypothetical protein